MEKVHDCHRSATTILAHYHFSIGSTNTTILHKSPNQSFSIKERTFLEFLVHELELRGKWSQDAFSSRIDQHSRQVKIWWLFPPLMNMTRNFGCLVSFLTSLGDLGIF